ncbi:MAG: DUF488 family protein [Anaerolineae bacterium]
MPTVCTIGYQNKPLSHFIGQLRGAGVQAVIDIRLRNTSHLAGYTKQDTLEFLLQEGFGIAYEHHPELAPTDEILDGYRRKQDWDAYLAAFLPLLEERHMAEVGREILGRYDTVCLLCAEPGPERCHRRLVAEHWAERLPGVVVRHL